MLHAFVSRVGWVLTIFNDCEDMSGSMWRVSKDERYEGIQQSRVL